MPSKDAIIGRIAVKVLPDTSDFRKDLENDLKAIERSLKSVKIKVELDDSGIVAQAKALQNAIKQNLSDVKVSVGVEDAAFRESISEMESRLTSLNMRIVTELDEDSRREAEDEIRELRERIENLKSTIVPEISTPARLAVAANLAVLARDRTITLFPKVSALGVAQASTAIAALSGARYLHIYFDDLVRSIGNLDKSIPLIGTLAVAMAGLAGFGITAVSNLFALTASLAQIGPAVLALPGILGGMAIGVGTMVAALKDFHSVFPDVKQSLSEMQDLISKNFWAEAEGSMRTMIDQLLPQLSEGFGRTATALGGYFSGLADGIRDTMSSALGGMFADLAESIKIATGGTGALIGIITTLGTVGAGYLPRLATWFVDITTRFDEFLAKAQGDGRLQGWIDTAIEGLKDLGSILFSIGDIIMSIGQAAGAAGGSTLSVMADTLQRVADIVSSEPFNSQLIRVFTAAHEAMSNIALISGPSISNLFRTLSDTLIDILPLVSDTIGILGRALADGLANPELQAAIVVFFAAIREAAFDLAPVFAVLSEAIAAMLPVAAELVSVMAPIAAEIFGALAQVLTDLAPLLLTLVDFLGTQLLNAVKAVAPLITEFSGFLREHETVAKVLAGVIMTVVIVAYTAMAASAVLTAASSVASWLAIATSSSVASMGVKKSVGQIIASHALMAAKALLHGLAVAAVWTVQIVAKAVWATAQLAAQIALQVAKWAFLAAKALVHGLAVAAVWTVQIIASAVTATAKVAVQIGLQVAKWVWFGAQALLNGAKVAAAWLLALGPIGIIIAAVAGAVALIIIYWDDIVRVFKAGIEKVTGFVSDLPGKIKGYFNGAKDWLVDAGRKIIDGLIGGLKAGFQKVKDTLSSLTDSLPSWKGPAERDKTLLTNAGELIIGGLIRGMESQYSAVKRSLTGLGSDIGSTVLGSPEIAKLTGPTGSATSGLASAVAGSEGSGTTKVFNYYAAPGSSLSSEEELFAATSRTRMVGW